MNPAILLLVPILVILAHWQNHKRNYFFSGVMYAATAVPFMLVDGTVFGPVVLYLGIAAGLTWARAYLGQSR